MHYFNSLQCSVLTAGVEEAARKNWAKFGLEKNKPKGPQPDTTTIGENILFKPSRDWRNKEIEDAKEGGGKHEEKSLKEQLRDKKVKCRICQGEHFTARCPFKDSMNPMGDDGNPAADPLAEGDEKAPKEGGLGVGGSSYVPPHMRKGATGGGDKLGGKYERDDLATLRVTNVSFPGRYLPNLHTANQLFRYQKWPKKTTFDRSSSTLAALRVFSLRRIEKQEGPRASLSSRLSTGLMRRGRVRSSMALATSILSCGWSLQRGRPDGFLGSYHRRNEGYIQCYSDGFAGVMNYFLSIFLSLSAGSVKPIGASFLLLSS